MEKCEPKAIIENGKVVNADKLRHYWEERNRLNYRMRRGMFADLEALSELSQPEREQLKIGDVQEPEWIMQLDISGRLSQIQSELAYMRRQPERQWTNRQWDTVSQLKLQVSHLQSKVIEYQKQKKAETPKASKPDRVDVTDRYYK